MSASFSTGQVISSVFFWGTVPRVFNQPAKAFPCKTYSDISPLTTISRLPCTHKWRGEQQLDCRTKALPRAINQEYENDGELQKRQFVQALLLAWYGSQHRSLFAAKCLVETCIEIYRAGYTLDDVKLALSFVGLGYGGKLLTPLHEDILLSWVALIMMTLKTVGVAPYAEGMKRLEARGSRELTESTHRMTLGLQMFVKQALDMFLSGTNLQRLQLQQRVGGQAAEIEGGQEAQGLSPAIQIMQQNTRLVIITLEVVRGLELPTELPLQPAPPPESAGEESVESMDAEMPNELISAPAGSSGKDSQTSSQQPSSSREELALVGYIPSFLHPIASINREAENASLGGSFTHSTAVQKRAAAVRLLIGFMGAASGWVYSAWDFIDSTADCYQLGWTADELYKALDEEEFAQSGGVLPIGVAGMGGEERISATLFSNWLSLVYITMAQLGVPHPGSEEKVGWAWAGSLSHNDPSSPEAVQAQGMANFVSNTLRLESEKEKGAGGGRTRGQWSISQEAAPSAESAAVKCGGAEQLESQRAQPREGFVRLEDPGLARTSAFALLMSQQISLVQMTRQRVLAAASSPNSVSA